MQNLTRLAELIKARTQIEREIATAIGRPTTLESVGEYIASAIFGIVLHGPSPDRSGAGYFARGTLAGKSATMRWYTRQEYTLDLDVRHPPDYYLIMTGPRVGSGPWLSSARPWAIDAVFLFDARDLSTILEARHAQPGAATTLRVEDWESAELYPIQRNRRLIVTEEQRELLALFA